MDETVNEYRLLMTENVIYNDEVDNDEVDNELVEIILLIAEEINEEIEEIFLINENDQRYDALMKATSGKWNRLGRAKQKDFMKKFTYNSKSGKFEARKKGVKGILQKAGKVIASKIIPRRKGKREQNASINSMKNSKSFGTSYKSIGKVLRTSRALTQ